MITPRGLSSTPPPATTRIQDNPTLLFSWWCTGFAIAAILVRLSGRLVRNNRLFPEDRIMMASMIPLCARMGLVHVVLIWGTNNVEISGGFTEVQLRHREIGSKLVLPARIMYALFIWMAKLTISEFLKRLTSNFWKRSYELTLRGIRVSLLVTFIAVVIATLAECQPFDHYWQVIPDPGAQCRMGYAQLFTMGAADMLTDAMLILFPVSLIARSPAFPLNRKFRLILLFSLSGILMGVTGFRITSVIAHHGKQQYRTVWASGEILGAAAVANAIVIGSFLRDRGVKKQKYKYNSVTDSMERASKRADTRSVLTHNTANDSDDDLFHGMCYRTTHDTEAAAPRAPPLAMVSPGTRRDSSTGLEVPEDYFPHQKSDNSRDSQESDLQTAVEAPLASPAYHEAASTSSPRRQRQVSFCDVGGLLEDASSQSSTLASSSPRTQDFAPSNFSSRRGSEITGPAYARRGSRAMFSDFTGFLSPILQSQKRGSTDDSSRKGSRDSSSTADISMASGGLSPLPMTPLAGVLLRRTETEQSLQDVGGLLDSSIASQIPLPLSPLSMSGYTLQPPTTSLDRPSSSNTTNFSKPHHSSTPSPSR